MEKNYQNQVRKKEKRKNKGNNRKTNNEMFNEIPPNRIWHGNYSFHEKGMFDCFDILPFSIRKFLSVNDIFERQQRYNFPKIFVDEIKLVHDLNYRSECRSIAFMYFKKNSIYKISQQDSDKSTDLREMGNAALRDNRDLHNVLELYTRAIRMSHKNSMELALAHANRSVVLIELQRFLEAYEDCELAKEMFYPYNKLEKILQRQAHCAIELKDKNKLKQTLNEFIKYSIKNKCDQNKLNEYKLKLIELESIANKTLRTLDTETEINNILLENGKNVVSDALKQTEIIYTEKAFAFVPIENPEKFMVDTFNTNRACQNCARLNIIRFYCEICRFATYCSRNCKTEHNYIHRYECEFYVSKTFPFNTTEHLAFRTFLCGFEELSQVLLKNNKKYSNPKDLFDEIIKISENNPVFQYGKMLKLNPFFDQMNFDEFIQYAKAALALSLYLRMSTNFFEKISDELHLIMEEQLDWEILITAILMRHIGQVIRYSRCISSIIPEVQSNLRNVIWQNNFLAFFPRISNLKHSCDPNTYNRYNGIELNILAIKNLSKGDEVFTCFGPHYRFMNTLARKEILTKQFGYKCECNKCLTEDDALQKHFFLCQHCGYKLTSDCNFIAMLTDEYIAKYNLSMCPRCKHSMQVITVLQLFQKNFAIAEATENMNKPLFESFHWMYNEAKKGIPENKPILHQILICTFLHFYDFIFQQSQAHEQFTELVLENIKITKELYGEFCEEYPYALMPLLDIMAYRKKVNMPQVKEGHQMIENIPKVSSDEVISLLDNFIKQYII